MKKWEVVFTKQAQKDAKKLSQSGLKSQAEKLFKIFEHNPFKSLFPYEKLVGDLSVEQGEDGAKEGCVT